ncbi:uncharacterized protein CDV56_107593 [Aspergillus thermomutatus]|uniref:Uncharacterized protein n=1 Tax=Aspergillus thermomutatus TaxID=41047 RepID=A0A397HG84_ASPTH|nr:uncharacterized protein CDV56_107593 [Aspergillus thermomutatus]RHZ62151.1 hypothetical protein CDV56_107593 [Aspergillus thermomutatus]
MEDYRAKGRLQDSVVWPEFRASEILEISGLRHSIVGDAIIRILGYPLVISDLYLAIADEQLQDAYSILLDNGFNDVPGVDLAYRYEHAIESPAGWPGYRLVVDPSAQLQATRVMLVPATFWHLNLEPESFSANTFLFPDSRCRFPRRLFYLHALIDVISERDQKSGFNTNITGYFKLQYSYLLAVIPKDLIALLSEEDRFFVDLFQKVLLPSARKKVCLQRQQIRMGCITVEAARQSIPRKDLALAALKRKYQKGTINLADNPPCG